MPLQLFPLKAPIEQDSQMAVVHMLGTPAVGNAIYFRFEHFTLNDRTDPDHKDICRNVTCGMCLQLELYGKDLGLYKLCGSRKYPYTPQGRSLGIARGVGGLKSETF